MAEDWGNGPAHNVEWYGTYRGTEDDPRQVGWCGECDDEVYHGDSPEHDDTVCFDPCPLCGKEGPHFHEIP